MLGSFCTDPMPPSGASFDKIRSPQIDQRSHIPNTGLDAIPTAAHAMQCEGKEYKGALKPVLEMFVL